MIALAIWLLLFGMWPLLDPGHDPTTLLGLADLTLHLAAGGWLGWRLANRSPAT